VFLAFALYRLAQVRRQQSADSDRVLPDYERAVSALEAVNAEQDLARASDQLAILRSGKREPDALDE
jgi:hypothetical protein